MADRKQSRIPLGARRAAALLEALLADSRDALIVTDADEVVIGVNPEWPALCGDGTGEAIGKSFTEVACSCHHCEVADLLRRARSEGRPIGAVITHRHRRGFDLRLAARITPIAPDEGGAGAYLVRLRPAGAPPR